MIGHGSGQRVDPFDRVETIHRAAGGAGAPSVGKPPRVPNHLGISEERVGVEGQNDRRLIQPEHEVEIASRGRP